MHSLNAIKSSCANLITVCECEPIKHNSLSAVGFCMWFSFRNLYFLSFLEQRCFCVAWNNAVNNNSLVSAGNFFGGGSPAFAEYVFCDGFAKLAENVLLVISDNPVHNN